VLRILGSIGDDQREFVVAIGEAGHDKHQCRRGDRVSGEGIRVADPQIEIAPCGTR
jgi:hypothetical protein